jgi:hypothetical protein
MPSSRPIGVSVTCSAATAITSACIGVPAPGFFSKQISPTAGITPVARTIVP